MHARHIKIAVLCAAPILWVLAGIVEGIFAESMWGLSWDEPFDSKFRLVLASATESIGISIPYGFCIWLAWRNLRQCSKWKLFLYGLLFLPICCVCETLGHRIYLYFYFGGDLSAFDMSQPIGVGTGDHVLSDFYPDVIECLCLVLVLGFWREWTGLGLVRESEPKPTKRSSIRSLFLLTTFIAVLMTVVFATLESLAASELDVTDMAFDFRIVSQIIFPVAHAICVAVAIILLANICLRNPWRACAAILVAFVVMLLPYSIRDSLVVELFKVKPWWEAVVPDSGRWIGTLVSLSAFGGCLGILRMSGLKISIAWSGKVESMAS